MLPKCWPDYLKTAISGIFPVLLTGKKIFHEKRISSQPKYNSAPYLKRHNYYSPGDFWVFLIGPKICVHMEFFCWNVLNRSLGVKNRRVPLYSPWAFSIMAEFSKWRISKILKFLSLQIQAYYILLERIFHAEQLFCLRKSLKMYSMWVKSLTRCQNDVIIFQNFDICSKLLSIIYRC